MCFSLLEILTFFVELKTRFYFFVFAILRGKNAKKTFVFCNFIEGIILAFCLEKEKKVLVFYVFLVLGRNLLRGHHSNEFFVVGLAVAVNVCLPDHLVDLFVGQFLAQVGHDMPQFGGGDETPTSSALIPL